VLSSLTQKVQQMTFKELGAFLSYSKSTPEAHYEAIKNTIASTFDIDSSTQPIDSKSTSQGTIYFISYHFKKGKRSGIFVPLLPIVVLKEKIQWCILEKGVLDFYSPNKVLFNKEIKRIKNVKS